MYDAGAREYERHAETSIFNARYERPAMLAAIGDVRGLRVLDAGCAAGYYSATLAPAARSVIAVDRSEAMIDLVRAKRAPNVTVRVHDLSEPMPWLDDGAIDLIVSSLTMHYLASWDTTLREFCRVLAPGGRLIVSTHHPAMTAPLVANYFETQLVDDTWAINGVETNVSFYHRPLEAILNAFIDAGLAIARIEEPRLAERTDATEAERRLATRPWFLTIEASRYIRSNQAS